jgi:flagellar biogenesis protein FliO
MNDVNFGDLVGRMAISLAVVLGLMYIGYRLLKRRQNGPSPVRARRSPLAGMFGAGRSAGAGRSSGQRTGNAKRGLKVVARVGLSKTSSVIAVQFGERVFMLGASDQAPPKVLAEIDLPSWTSSIEEPEDSMPMTRVPVGAKPAAGRRPSIIDALREMTARRA